MTVSTNARLTLPVRVACQPVTVSPTANWVLYVGPTFPALQGVCTIRRIDPSGRYHLTHVRSVGSWDCFCSACGGPLDSDSCPSCHLPLLAAMPLHIGNPYHVGETTGEHNGLPVLRTL